MALFRYECLDTLGKKKIESSEAKDKEEVLNNLQNQSMVLIRWLDQGGKAGFFSKQSSSRVLKQAQLMQFTKDIAHLLKADMPMDRALGIIEESADEKPLKKMSTDLRKAVREGTSLSEAMAAMPADFSTLYVNMVRVGEEGGILSPVMERLAGFLERSEEIRRYIISTSIYPSILLSVGIISVFIIMGFVVPRFAGIFNDLGQEMPMSTQILMQMSLFLSQWWWLIILVAVTAGGVLWRMVKTDRGKDLIDKFILRTPLIGSLVVNIQVGLFARTLGTLVQSDVPILKALFIVKDIIGNNVLKDIVGYIADQVRQGGKISLLMREKKIFPPMVVQMVALGEESGRLGKMLEAAADDLDIKNQNRIKNMLALLEPVAILVMAVVIGGIVVSMLSTIFGINEISF
jgi:type II secretory pathway component PulF